MAQMKITDPSQIPTGMSEKEETKFWNDHELTREFFEKLTPTPAEELPSSRSKPVSMRLPENDIRRLKTLAKERGRGYQTLAKEFIAKELDREEGVKEETASLERWMQQVMDRLGQLEKRLTERVVCLEEHVGQLAQAALEKEFGPLGWVPELLQEKQEYVEHPKAYAAAYGLPAWNLTEGIEGYRFSRLPLTSEEQSGKTAEDLIDFAVQSIRSETAGAKIAGAKIFSLSWPPAKRATGEHSLGSSKTKPEALKAKTAAE